MSNRLERIASEGYDFKFSEYINKGFDLCRKHWIHFAITSFLYVLILYVVNNFFNQIGVVGNLLSITKAFLNVLLTVGFYLMISKIDQGKTPSISDLFSGFKYFNTLLGYVFFSAILSIFVFGIAAFTMLDLLSTNGIPYDTVSSSLLVVSIILILFVVLFSVTPLLIVFHDFGTLEAFKMSFRLVSKKLLLVVLFYMATALIMIAGVVGFGIGILFTIPAMLAAHYYAFADVTGLNTGTIEDDILDHLVEDF